MINLINKDGKTVKRHYECTSEVSIDLCMANIECLLQIALADPDEHIAKLGGEWHLLELMNGYIDIIERLNKIKPIIDDICRAKGADDE